jgi:hypothetical protein
MQMSVDGPLRAGPLQGNLLLPPPRLHPLPSANAGFANARAMQDESHPICAIWQRLAVVTLSDMCSDPLAPARAAALQDIGTCAAAT